jgi:flagellar hook-associated protein 2
MGVSLNPASILSGQGINVSSVVQQIIGEQSGQLSVWQAQQTSFATQDGLLEGEENNLTNLQTAVAALSSPTGALTAQAANSSQQGIVTATANSTAVSGTHQIVVTSLATTGSLYTNAFAAGATTSFLAAGQTTGDIQLLAGGVGGTSRDIVITQGSNDTLTTLASYINTQSSANNWGVTASVVSDGSGSRLSLASQNSGAAGALSVAANTNTTLTFAAPQGGANAVLSVDGIPFSSATNIVSGVIQGVTLNLVSQSPGNQVQLTVSPDLGQITDAVNNFISAYNTAVSTINSQYVVDPTGSIPAPPLEGDISLRSLQSSLLTDSSFAIGGNSGLVNLAALGINQANDGTLSLGLTPGGQTFATVLASNPAAVQNFFQNSTGTGFANNFNADLTGLTAPKSGPLNADLAQNQAENSDLTTTITNFETQLTTETTALTSQYDKVNASLQSYPLLLQLVTETLGSIGGSGSSSSTVSSSPTLTSGL